MAVALHTPRHLLPVPGIRISTAAAEIKYQNRDDVVLFELCKDTNIAVLFTQNQFCAAPVTIAKQHLDQTRSKFLLINSGNANAGLGEQGIMSAAQCCDGLANIANCNAKEILPFSTGVIGEPLPYKKIIAVSSALLKNLSEDAWMQAANAIMTTDTIAKGCSQQLKFGDKNVTITGIAKGSGMIRPDMATMLAYIGTDLQIEKEDLQRLVTQATNKSFNCITVDGDTSTNDACALIATGQSGVLYNQLSNSDKNQFITKLEEIFVTLAQSIIRDGEGATKFITIKVEQANDFNMARDIAFSIAQSPLVKTAAFASDPNWGRILAAAGRGSKQTLDLTKFSLYINNLSVVEGGEIAASYQESLGQKEMNNEELNLTIQLGQGESEITVWTTDLSYEYVKINAEYRS